MSPDKEKEMSVKRLEALLDAIAHLKGASTNPDGDLYQIRNPME